MSERIDLYFAIGPWGDRQFPTDPLSFPAFNYGERENHFRRTAVQGHHTDVMLNNGEKGTAPSASCEQSPGGAVLNPTSRPMSDRPSSSHPRPEEDYHTNHENLCQSRPVHSKCHFGPSQTHHRQITIRS
jgi:hypothetical protein